MAFYSGVRAIVSPGVNISQADCPNTRVMMSTYANGQLQSSIGPFVGVWFPGAGIIGPYCNFTGSNYQNEMYLPYNVNEARIAASAEHATINKGSQVWGSTIPVEVYLPPFLQ
jgi:hypothetical protein